MASPRDDGAIVGDGVGDDAATAVPSADPETAAEPDPEVCNGLADADYVAALEALPEHVALQLRDQLRGLAAEAGSARALAGQLRHEWRVDALRLGQANAELRADLDLAVAGRDTALAGRDATAGERDAALAARDATVGERDAALAERDAALAARDAAIAERDEAVGERSAAAERWRATESALAAVRSEVAELRAAVAGLSARLEQAPPARGYRLPLPGRR